VNIARRTVAKYRSAMGIASSSKRKQYFWSKLDFITRR
jgi:RNA polymerase sigma-54 factor